MAVRYIDFNRGNDANSGATPALAWKNLSMGFNFNPGAGGGLYLASDSIWEINLTKAAHNGLTQTQFNGIEGDPAFIAPYDPDGVSYGGMPTIRYRMFPAAADWTWDATDNWGHPKGWYIQFAWHNLTNDILVKVGSQWVPTTNQRSTGNKGFGSINGDYEGTYQGQFVNGMTRDTLRFNIDLGRVDVDGSIFTRLYLSGAGLLTSGAGNDPSTVLGAGQIMLGMRPYIYLFNSDTHLQVHGIRCEDGGGLFAIDGDANRISSGFEAYGNDFLNCGSPMMLISSTGDVATTRREVDIHDNTGDQLAGSFFTAFKVGIAGSFHDNNFSNGNKCSSMGGGVYIQIAASTVSGIAEPFVVENNVADNWANGTGNNTFDGSCYYVDIGDTGTILKNNLALNSYVAWQCGSGARSVWRNNTSINCELMGMWNNPESIPAYVYSDYEIDHNLHIGAQLGAFTHGQDTGVSPSAMVVTYSGTVTDIVGIAVRNNVFLMASGDTRMGANILTSAAWTAGKADVRNNAVACASSIKIGSDVGTVDRTASSATLSTTQAACRLQGDATDNYRIDPNSSLWAAGVDLDRVNTDAYGTHYYSPPSIGPHEPVRRNSYHMIPGTLA